MPRPETYPEVPGWEFTVDERSAGVFEVVALREDGRSIALVGVDPDALLAQARAEALASEPEQPPGPGPGSGEADW